MKNAHLQQEQLCVGKGDVSRDRQRKTSVAFVCSKHTHTQNTLKFISTFFPLKLK
jgi:hypothetical protein